MDWVQTFTIIGVLGAFVLWSSQRLEADIQKLDSDVKASNQRIDQTNQRLDGLYNVIIALLKKEK